MGIEILVIAAVAIVVLGLIAFVATRSRTPVIAPPRPVEEPAAEAAPVEAAPAAPEEAALAPEEAAVAPEVVAPPEEVVEAPVPPPVAEVPSVRERLARARSAFAGAFGAIRGRSSIDQASWDELEEALLLADVGLPLTSSVLEAVRARVAAEGRSSAEELLDAVREELRERLGPPAPLRYAERPPTVWLFVGVNGVGKTTTIGKVGHRLVSEGASVVMAAGDTFRAAAAEQLATWAERVGADLVAGAEGADPSSVIFDAIAHAAAGGAEVVLADTAGRLHTKSNLMEELAKVRRVADKGEGTVTEVLLVLDATTGQNGLTQARQFTEAVDLTGVVLTKLDGSAKGGIVFAIAAELGLPVKLVGLGEQASDLVDFDPEEFVAALFDRTDDGTS
jgi:fused signal recognition particle receptor